MAIFLLFDCDSLKSVTVIYILNTFYFTIVFMKNSNLKTNFCAILIILFFFINNIPTIFAQNKSAKPTLTAVEKKEAEDIAIQFALRFSQTKDLTPLLNEFFADDFIDQYKFEVLKDVGEQDKNVFLMPGIYINPKVLKSLTNEDWKHLYTSTNSFLLLQTSLLLKNSLTDEEKDMDRFMEKIFSPRLKKLFDDNLYFKLNTEETGEPQPINDIETLRKVLESINLGRNIINEDNPFSFTEKELRASFEDFGKRKELDIEVSLSDTSYPNLPKKTRVITVVSPNLCFLFLAKKDGKLKIISTELYAE